MKDLEESIKKKDADLIVLKSEEVKLQNAIRGLKKDIEGLKKEIQERDETIQDKVFDGNLAARMARFARSSRKNVSTN